MKKSPLNLKLITILIFLYFYCSPPAKFTIQHQVTGPIETNCYLLYDPESKEAALIDVGGPVDSLLLILNEKQLSLKYIFATHVHMDHVEGVPLIKQKFPSALLCYNKADYDSFLLSIDWGMNHFPPEITEELRQDPQTAKWFGYDLTIFGPPDICLEDNQVYKLGNLEIRTLLSPGHSVGSICYQVGTVLFSGDVLFYRTVGRTDLSGGSREELIQSVRRLYAILPDETIVYPGHNQPTDIGSEKKGNKKVTFDSVNFN
jgi:hydroxyacylglutathione hydrolase